MKLKHIYDLLTGKIKVLKPASITLSNIKGFLQSLFRKSKKDAGIEMETYIFEQIIWRRTQVMEKSPLCWEQGYCRVCGCDIIGRTMEDRACGISELAENERDAPMCYPEMMSKEVWEEFKKTNNIKLFD